MTAAFEPLLDVIAADPDGDVWEVPSGSRVAELLARRPELAGVGLALDAVGWWTA